MKHIKFLDKLFAKLGYFPMAFLPPNQIPIKRITENVLTISSCRYEGVIREMALRKGASFTKEMLIDKMRDEVLAEVAKYIEVTECVNPIEIRATLRIVNTNN